MANVQFDPIRDFEERRRRAKDAPSVYDSLQYGYRAVESEVERNRDFHQKHGHILTPEDNWKAGHQAGYAKGVSDVYKREQQPEPKRFYEQWFTYDQAKAKRWTDNLANEVEQLEKANKHTDRVYKEWKQEKPPAYGDSVDQRQAGNRSAEAWKGGMGWETPEQGGYNEEAIFLVEEKLPMYGDNMGQQYVGYNPQGAAW